MQSPYNTVITMKGINITELMDKCLLFFRCHNYSDDRIKRYKALWKKGILKFMAEENIQLYSSDVGFRFKAQCIPQEHFNDYIKDIIRSVNVLDAMLQQGSIPKRCTVPIEHPLNFPMGDKMEMFLNRLKEARRSKDTLLRHRIHLSGFLTWLNHNGITHIADIQESHLCQYISQRDTDLSNCISSLRGLFKFWVSQKMALSDFSEFFETLRVRKEERIPSFYNKDEVATIENSIDRSGSVGKRNYAILLLATRLGLRASDIAALSFNNIDWDKNLITLIMQKTGKIIELPLLPEVGNAIIAYLKYGRPKSILPQVFLCSVPPYTAMGIGAISTVVSNIIKKSPISPGQRRHGPHSMRHSLAGCLLANGTTVPTISEVLGHKKSQTTMTYLKIDLKSLSECSLSVPSVGKDFYMQEGGVFYD